MRLTFFFRRLHVTHAFEGPKFTIVLWTTSADSLLPGLGRSLRFCVTQLVLNLVRCQRFWPMSLSLCYLYLPALLYPSTTKPRLTLATQYEA